MSENCRLQTLVSCMEMMLDQQSTRLRFMLQFIELLPEESRENLAGLAQLLEDANDYVYNQKETLKIFAG